jgi:hypothetical protein
VNRRGRSSPEWASGGEVLGGGEETDGGVDERSPVQFFGP